MTSEIHHHHLLHQQQADPYVIYQLRKPHQRGTAVVPRLVPKSHAPAFSHANYRFTRIRAPPADDTSLYLPKSLDYPTNWGSFGSESSIWSGSSAASAFPNRVAPILKSSTRSKHEDAASSVASMTERTSLLSSEGTRSLKSFVRFEQQLHAHLPAPAPVRRPFGEFNDPYRFILPPALSEVEQEDRIVQAAIDDPSSVRSEDIEIDLTSGVPLVEEDEPIDVLQDVSRSLPKMRNSPIPTPTRKRRSLVAWLFGGGERELRGTRKYADVHAAPIMDEDEEARRRAQFVRGAGKHYRSGRLSRKRFSWKRSSSVGRNSDMGDRKTGGLGGSAKQLWSRLKRSASFTFGSKKKNEKPEDEKEPEMVGGLQDDPISPSSSFIQRKMASLRETAARRMVSGKKEVLIPETLLERREDRPRPNQQSSGLGSQISARQSRPTLDQLILARPELGHATSESVEKLANRINSDLSQGTTLQTLTEASGSLNQFNGDGASSSLESMQAARMKFQTSLVSSPADGNSMGSFAIVCEEEDRGSVSERLRSYGRNSGSGSSSDMKLSNASKMSLELLRARAAQVPLRPRVSGRDNSGHTGMHSRDNSDAHEKAFSRVEATLRSRVLHGGVPAQEKNSSGTINIFGPSVKERSRGYGRIERNAEDSSELVAMFRTGGSSGKLKLQEAANSSYRNRNRNRGNADFNDPHPTALDVYCQCPCACVYEAECQLSCDSKSGLSMKSAKSGGSKRSMEKVQERNLSALTAQSPSLSLLNGAREESSSAMLTEKAWMDAMRRKMDLSEEEAIRNKEWSGRYGRREEQRTNTAAAVRMNAEAKETRSTSSQEPRTRRIVPANPGLERMRQEQTEVRTGRPRVKAKSGIEYHGGVAVQRKKGQPKTQMRPRELSPGRSSARPISTPATSPPSDPLGSNGLVEEVVIGERRETDVGLVVVEKTRRVGAGGRSLLSRLTGK